MRSKRKFSALNDKGEALALESPKKSQIVNEESPMSSPLKGPLVEDSTESGSASFVARCFYGLKGSSSGKAKENYSSPKKKNVRNANMLSSENWPRILQDMRMNEKLLERIAASPIKQAVLQRCSVVEFRKLYRDEIKEIQCEKEFDERRITRKLSKIVWKQPEESDDGWDDSSNDRISFKISNRGFDIDSISNCSSSSRSENLMTPLKKNIINSPCDSAKKEPPSLKKTTAGENANNSRIDTPPSASSERKFFKTKSVGQSASASNVLLGKGFNLRFVSQNRNKNNKLKGQKKRASWTPQSGGKRQTFSEKLRLSGQSSPGSAVLTASSSVSSGGNTSVENSPSQSEIVSSKKYDGSGFDEDDHLDLMTVNKDTSCKTYGMETPKRQKMDYSSGNESPYDSMDDCSSAKDDSNNQSSILNEQNTQNSTESANGKLFPIFRSRNISKPVHESQSPVRRSSRSAHKVVNDDQNQMVIDAGQKKFGATQCQVCGMVYCHADATDETAHGKFHARLLEVLKFPGWKKERVVQENPLDCSKIILILSDDPRSHRKKVDEIYEVMGRDLGFPGDAPFSNPYRKVFLSVSVDKEIEGCCVAEPIKEGNRVIPGYLDANDASGRRPWCCEKVPEPALMGISRLWVVSQKRRSGVASRLVEAVQQWFDYGSFIPKDMIAFSDPTPDGRRFAHRFTGTPTFLVYKYK